MHSWAWSHTLRDPKAGVVDPQREFVWRGPLLDAGFFGMLYSTSSASFLGARGVPRRTGLDVMRFAQCGRSGGAWRHPGANLTPDSQR